MPVTFHKMHGLGNDFILLDLRQQDFHINSSVAARLADRRTGIGCDQILILRKPGSEQHIASFEIWNSDGTPCEQCGNGVRCMGRYLFDRGETPADQFLLAGPAGIVKIECLDDGQVRVDMGMPSFEAHRVPIALEAVNDWYPITIDGQRYQMGATSMGNPHSLVVVEDLNKTDIGHLGEIFSKHPVFPEGCNAGFAQILDRENIRLRVFERGAAETRACGSGACAAVSILRKANLVEPTVNVTQAGGSLIISWTGGANPVIMTGPATHVFRGKFG